MDGNVKTINGRVSHPTAACPETQNRGKRRNVKVVGGVGGTDKGANI